MSTASPTATPGFAQPKPGPDPSCFKTPHPSDDGLYAQTDSTLVEHFPAPRGGTEPVLTLEQVWGAQGGPGKVQAITAAGQIVFHAVGDTGSVKSPKTEDAVADAMVADLESSGAEETPAFFFHLGDVVYSFGEAKYYYDQFFEPYRAYSAPILAAAGNHDGVVYKTDPAPTLQAWLRNFCAEAPEPTPDAAGLVRTTMIQPGVFFTFDAPFVRILALYSNVLEDPGVISSEGGTRPTLNDSQIDFLTAALTRCREEKYAGAVLIVVHHPPYTAGTTHGGSPLELADMDKACLAAGFWPHAVLSGHAHNYQRFTRTVHPGQSGSFQIAYMVAGNGGHALDALRKINGKKIAVPLVVDPTLTLEEYDDTHYGFLRLTANSKKLVIEYHRAGKKAGKAVDSVTVTLATRAVS
jgi:hypothetical protein